jgi:hypothetical protein
VPNVEDPLRNLEKATKKTPETTSETIQSTITEDHTEGPSEHDIEDPRTIEDSREDYTQDST